jgi:hypothetical protein
VRGAAADTADVIDETNDFDREAHSPELTNGWRRTASGYSPPRKRFGCAGPATIFSRVDSPKQVMQLISWL